MKTTYRLAYDNVFISDDFDGGITYKGEKISHISVYLVYKVIDKKTGTERYFESKELIEQKLEYAEGQFCSARDFYRCVIEKEGYRLIPNEQLQESNYTVHIEVGDCIKWDEKGLPEIINHAEVIDILVNNYSEFDNANNKPTQSTSYYAIEVRPKIPTH